MGSGFEEVPYLLFGAAPVTQGRLTLEDRTYDLTSLEPRDALDLGIALIPADRQMDASVPELSVGDNVMLQVLDRYFGHGILSVRRLKWDAAEQLQRFDVRPAEPRLTYSSLSGGNQQKALLAKWLQTQPRLLLLHEPTQGVDVGSRQQIFEFLRLLAAERRAVICASSDYEQLAAVCDRVIVLTRGRIGSELIGSEITKERIAERCYSGAMGDSTVSPVNRNTGLA
jgi:ribose transport system ATP-binding protein